MLVKLLGLGIFLNCVTKFFYKIVNCNFNVCNFDNFVRKFFRYKVYCHCNLWLFIDLNNRWLTQKFWGLASNILSYSVSI